MLIGSYMSPCIRCLAMQFALRHLYASRLRLMPLVLWLLFTWFVDCSVLLLVVSDLRPFSRFVPVASLCWVPFYCVSFLRCSLYFDVRWDLFVETCVFLVMVYRLCVRICLSALYVWIGGAVNCAP